MNGLDLTDTGSVKGGLDWYYKATAHPAWHDLTTKGASMAAIIGIRVQRGHDFVALDTSELRHLTGTKDSNTRRCRVGSDGIRELVNSGFLSPASGNMGMFYLRIPVSERVDNDQTDRPEVYQIGTRAYQNGTEVYQIGTEVYQIGTRSKEVKHRSIQKHSEHICEPTDSRQAGGELADLVTVADRVFDLWGHSGQGRNRARVAFARSVRQLVDEMARFSTDAEAAAWLEQRAAEVRPTLTSFVPWVEKWLDNGGWDIETRNPEAEAEAKAKADADDFHAQLEAYRRSTGGVA